MSERSPTPNSIELAADIVSAFVSNNSVPVGELPALIGSVHAALTKVANGPTEKPFEAPVPAVPVKKSITPDFLVSLEDGRRYKSLKRHLAGRGLTPEQYREKWGLPRDYPMVAPNYAQQRSALAKSMGLGQQRRKALQAQAAPAQAGGGEEAPAAAPARGRRKRTA